MGPEQDPIEPKPPKEDIRSSSEIENDIRKTRDRLDNTINNLSERLNPRALINGVLTWFGSGGVRQIRQGQGESFKRGYQEVIRQVKNNPMPALLVGAGITWIIFSRGSDDSSNPEDETATEGIDDPAKRTSRSDEIESMTHEESENSGITSKVKEKAEQAQELISGATEAVREKTSNLASGVQVKAGAARNAITERVRLGKRLGSDASHHLQKSYAYAGDRFQEAVEEYPLAVAVGFLGAGLLTGLLLPRTRQEDRLMGETSDQLIEQIKETGKETLDKAKAVAERVGQTAMEEAKKQGITPEAASGKISEVAGKVATVAAEAKEEAARAAEEERPKGTTGT
jgi:Protein of unknown function (DUF3618)